ncbi:MAG TPA: cysteine desulfurase family protein [Bacilli bacterium]
MQYFDHSATTPPYDEVAATVAQVMREFYGNPSSLHKIGGAAENLLEQAREVIARHMRVKPGEVIFTSGGTESNNLAIKGVARRFKSRGRHVITSAIEHPSVLQPFAELASEGFRVTYLPVDKTGSVRTEDVERALSDDTILVSIMHVNNEMGRIQPIREIGNMLKKFPKICFHVDAVQSVGKIPVYFKDWGIDLLSSSAHKFRGPKGIGFLLKREGLEIAPLIVGGGQEKGLRSGTENVPLIVGMAKALRMTMEQQANNMELLYRYRAQLIDRLRRISAIAVTGSHEMPEMAPHIVHFTFPGMRAEVVVHALEEKGYCVSSQSACSSGEEKPSRVLMAMGMSEAAAKSGIRVSMSPMHTADDIAGIAEAIAATVDEFKKVVKTR